MHVKPAISWGLETLSRRFTNSHFEGDYHMSIFLNTYDKPNSGLPEWVGTLQRLQLKLSADQEDD